MAEVDPRMIVLKRENERLREQLAQSDQLVEWLSKENAALTRQMEKLVPQLNEINDKARVITDWVQWAEPEIEKWRERYYSSAAEIEGLNKLSGDLMRELDAAFARADSLRVELATTNRENEYLRERVAFLEKVLKSKPGTMYFGSEGFFLRGEDGDDE